MNESMNEWRDGAWIVWQQKLERARAFLGITDPLGHALHSASQLLPWMSRDKGHNSPI